MPAHTGLSIYSHVANSLPPVMDRHRHSPNTAPDLRKPILAIWAIADIYGGVQVLVARFARYLAANGIDFILVTKNGTRIANEVSWAQQIDYRELPEHPVTFTHVFFPHVAALRENVPWPTIGHARISCWLVHPTEIFTSFYPRTDRLLLWFGCSFARIIQAFYRGHTRRMRGLLQKLIDTNALFVMDGATQRGLAQFYPGLRGACKMIPLPVELQHTPARPPTQKDPQHTLSVGYLGRLDEFKLSALIPFITRSLGRLAKQYTVTLHLISEGHGIADVRRACHDAGIYVHEHGFLPNAQAKQLIAERTDFAACMGTAALDIASIGHPCIIIDPAHHRKSRPQQRFIFVHEITEFTVGEFRDCPHYREGLHTIEQIALQIRTDAHLGEKCLGYVQTAHAPDRVFSQLVKQITDSALPADQIAGPATDFRRSYLKISERVSRLLNNLNPC
jgi:hypothetical protein